MNELERVEAEGYAVFCEVLEGNATRVRGGVCLSAPLQVTELNRVTDVRSDLDLDAVGGVYAGKLHLVSVPPWVDGLDAALETKGYTPSYAWMKFERPPDPPPAFETTLRIEDATDPAVFGATLSEGFGAPPGTWPRMRILGRPGWHFFLAWDADEPAAAASLFVLDGVAWFAGAATRPAFRGRGAQSALLATRIERARAVGARRLTVETGEQVDGKPDQSYRNILRAGFREAYLRPNWRSPD